MVMQEAAASQALRARILGRDAARRVELLRLRFEEDMPIRDIARAWDADPAAVHKEYARARREFQDALREVVAFHAPGSDEEIEEECKELLALLA
jgi:RNA polymerase sigma-70 factor (ECF subfamily)